MDTELTARQMPHSLEAEQAVLGSVLIDSSCVPNIIGIVKPEDFYMQQNREIFEKMLQMNERMFNQATESLAKKSGETNNTTTQIIK